VEAMYGTGQIRTQI